MKKPRAKAPKGEAKPRVRKPKADTAAAGPAVVEVGTDPATEAKKRPAPKAEKKARSVAVSNYASERIAEMQEDYMSAAVMLSNPDVWKYVVAREAAERVAHHRPTNKEFSQQQKEMSDKLADAFDEQVNIVRADLAKEKSDILRLPPASWTLRQNFIEKMKDARPCLRFGSLSRYRL